MAVSRVWQAPRGPRVSRHGRAQAVCAVRWEGDKVRRNESIEKLRQTTVPAAAAAPPATNGHASVFAAGQAAKRKRVPLDYASVKVKKDVPLPPPRASAPTVINASQALLDRMEVGDMVELSEVHAKTLTTYARNKKYRTAMRTLSATTFGVWLVGLPATKKREAA